MMKLLTMSILKQMMRNLMILILKRRYLRFELSQIF